MANHKSAEKRNRQTIKRTTRNVHFRSRMRTAIKKLRTLIAAQKPKEAQEYLKELASTIASTASRGIIKKTTASRYISRLSRQVAQIAK